jgi:DNA processing protein
MAFDRPMVIELTPSHPRYPTGVVSGRKAPVLSALGNLDLLDRPGIGFCGSRKASEKGLSVAADCAEQAVAAGFVVISGNAAGIDLEAHRAALQHGGATILVLPEGIEKFRVRQELRPVWDWARVLVISQFVPQAVWQAYRAMERNEIIIGLSRAMIVVEAGETGGTLAAGLRTLEIGKPLFVAQYDNMEAVAPGNAQLLGMGAKRLMRSRETGKASVAMIHEIAIAPRPLQPALL